jgi:hypothetical protein
MGLWYPSTASSQVVMAPWSMERVYRSRKIFVLRETPGIASVPRSDDMAGPVASGCPIELDLHVGRTQAASVIQLLQCHRPRPPKIHRPFKFKRTSKSRLHLRTRPLFAIKGAAENRRKLDPDPHLIVFTPHIAGSY